MCLKIKIIFMIFTFFKLNYFATADSYIDSNLTARQKRNSNFSTKKIYESKLDFHKIEILTSKHLGHTTVKIESLDTSSPGERKKTFVDKTTRWNGSDTKRDQFRNIINEVANSGSTLVIYKSKNGKYLHFRNKRN